MDYFTDRSPAVEAKLTEWNLPYRFEPEYPVDKIRRTDESQVRFRGNIAPKDAVAQYKVQMANGAKFPPILITQTSDLIDGNTRLEAAMDLKVKIIPVLITEVASFRLGRALGGAINNMNGVRLTAEEAGESVRIFMEQNFTDLAIAREIGRTVEEARRLRNLVEFQDRAGQLGMTTDAVLSMRVTDRLALNRIKHSEPFAEALNLVLNYQPPSAAIVELTKKIELAESDAESLNLIGRTREQLVPAGPPPLRPTVAPKVRQANLAVSSLLKLQEKPGDAVDLRPDQRPAMAEKWRQVHSLAGRMVELYSSAF